MIKICHLLCYLLHGAFTLPKMADSCEELLQSYSLAEVEPPSPFLVDSDDQGCDRHVVAPPAFMQVLSSNSYPDLGSALSDC